MCNRYQFPLIVLVLLIAGCTTESGQTTSDDVVEPTYREVQADPIASGRETFEQHCMSCHGQDAQGNGPAAEILSRPPTNLTLLAQNNEGEFPAERVYRSIDGREAFVAHGTREMPFWGNIWIEEDGVPRPEEEVDREISQVVEYLRSIQQ